MSVILSLVKYPWSTTVATWQHDLCNSGPSMDNICKEFVCYPKMCCTWVQELWFPHANQNILKGNFNLSALAIEFLTI